MAETARVPSRRAAWVLLSLETIGKGCSYVLLATRNWIHAHLYLGELDEQAGDEASACGHYAKVLDRWGHAKPRSVTADKARERVKALGCAK
jgi:hypothetical protein